MPKKGTVYLCQSLRDRAVTWHVIWEMVHAFRDGVHSTSLNANFHGVLRNLSRGDSGADALKTQVEGISPHATTPTVSQQKDKAYGQHNHLFKAQRRMT